MTLWVLAVGGAAVLLALLGVLETGWRRSGLTLLAEIAASELAADRAERDLAAALLAGRISPARYRSSLATLARAAQLDGQSGPPDGQSGPRPPRR